MPVTIIKGYKMKGSDIRTLEEALLSLRKEVELKGKRLYTNLLAQELQELVDDVAFNMIQRPETSLYDVAVQMLDARISNAIGRNLPVRHNLGVQAVVFTHKGDTYIKLNINNEKFAKALKQVATLNDYSLFDEQIESKQNKERGDVWNEIKEIYSDGNNPMIKNLFPTGPIQPEWKHIADKFDSRERRIERRVRHQLTSRLLNIIGMNQEIPPHKLLPYLDEAMEMLDNDGIRADAAHMQSQAQQVVVNITEDFVKRNPKEAPPQTFEDAEAPSEIVETNASKEQ